MAIKTSNNHYAKKDRYNFCSLADRTKDEVSHILGRYRKSSQINQPFTLIISQENLPTLFNGQMNGQFI